MSRKYILEGSIVEKKLNRLALEIVEHNIEEGELVFVGIEPGGVVLARRIKELVEKISGIRIALLTLTMDKKKPQDITLSKNINIDGKVVIVIDDVTNSGKTLLYAIKPFLAHEPKNIQTLVLVERSHAQFPVNAVYKGLSLATTLQEHIVVETSGEKITGAYLD